jgi:hypothetical protein
MSAISGSGAAYGPGYDPLPAPAETGVAADKVAAIRAMLSEAIARAEASPSRTASAVPTREELLARVANLHQQVGAARNYAEYVSGELLRAQILTEAAALRAKIEAARLRAEAALIDAAREELLGQLAALQVEAKKFFARLRLVPGVIVP